MMMYTAVMKTIKSFSFLSIVFMNICSVAQVHFYSKNPALAAIDSHKAPLNEKEDSILSHFILMAEQNETTYLGFPAEDDKNLTNIARPAKSYILASSFNAEDLLGSWAVVVKDYGYVPIFMLNNYYAFPEDYRGNKGMPYIIYKDKLLIYCDDVLKQGKILDIKNDTLRIIWQGDKAISIYVKMTFKE